MAITIPNTFVAGTKIEASPMNANFAEVANAVDKRGDTVTGNIAANAGVKFDGVDLSTIPNSSGTFDPLFAQVVVGSADTNGIRLDLESGTLAVREGDDSAYAPLITGVLTSTSTFIHGTGENTATPVGSTFRAPNATGTDIAGANLTIAAGNGTGTGGSGSIFFQTAPAGSTGSTANTLTTRMSINSVGGVAITGSAGGSLSYTSPAATYGAVVCAMTSGPSIQLAANSSITELRATTNHPIVFYTNNTDRIRLLADGTALQPSTNDGSALGSATVSWADLFLASGGVLNFNNGDVTVTHSANTLAFAGASTAYTFADGPVRPASNDGAALGVSGTAWSDLFLASGGVINFNAGDVTITHATDKISVEGGDLTVGTTTAQGRITALTTQGNATVANVIMAYGANTSWPIGFSNVYDANFVDSIFSINTRPVSGSRGSVLYSGSTAGYVLYMNGDGTGALSFQSVPGGSNQSATERMRLNSAGNLGIGLAPSAWGTNNDTRAIQLKSGSVWSFGTANLFIGQNNYYNGTNRIYSATAAAAELSITGGEYSFFTAPSGTAGNAITFTERFRIGNTGNIGIGATAKFYLDGVAGTGDTHISENSSNLIYVTAGGTTALIVNGNVSPYVYVNNSDLYLTATKRFYLDGGSDTFIYESAANSINFVTGGSSRLTIDDNYIAQINASAPGIGITTAATGTGTGTTVVRSSNSVLYLLSSSRRFKENIATADVTDAQLDAFLALTPCWWDYTGQKNGALGFIAEDLAALPLERYGSSPLCNFDKDGVVESNRDYALIAMQHLLIQRLERKVAALEARLN